MKKAISYTLVTSLVFVNVTAFAQDISSDVYRVATPKEILLHDNPYNILQQEIEAHICDNDWGISQKPFLLSDNLNEKIVITNYLKGLGNIPVFMRKGETFDIRMKQKSPLFKAYLEENKKQTEAFQERSSHISSEGKDELAAITSKNKQYFKYLEQAEDRTRIGTITLELNAAVTDITSIGKAVLKPISVAGINQVALFVQLPDDQSADTGYNAILYIGNWPKLSAAKTLFFHFIKNNSGEPIIENMLIEISAFNYNKMMKMIHSIEWTKLKALVKE